MKHSLLRIFATALALVGLASEAQAQISLSGFNPYTQDFDALTTTSATYTNNTTVPGMYGEAYVYMPKSATVPVAGYYPYVPDRLVANDGSNTTANFYSLGAAGSTERAFGGLATNQDGVGYAGLRFKNATGKTIKNLEVTYTMEQWYNSGTLDQAKFDVDYRTGATVTSLQGTTPSTPTSGWTNVADLTVYAPSTTKPITNQNGNVPSNRVTVSGIIRNLNLANGQEVMLRWRYSLNNSTNGNGLALDDVTVTPQSNIFYSKSSTTSMLNDLSTWGNNENGTGTAPANFTTADQVYYVQGNDNGTSRLNGNWTVSGANTKIIVGQSNAAATLTLASNRDINAVVDVAKGSTLVLQKSNPSLQLGTLNTGSTVEYKGSGNTAHSIVAAAYSNLTLTGNGDKTLAGNITASEGIALQSGATPVLGDFNVTLSSTATLAGADASNYFVTNGKGLLRLPVVGVRGGVATPVLFPVGASASSYTPVTLTQTTTQSQDIFEVRVADGVYPNYDANGNGLGTAISNQTVLKTWHVSKENPGVATNTTMLLQWPKAAASSNFVLANAHINHYSGGKWDVYSGEVGGSGTNTQQVTRTGITSFSPFAVSSLPRGVLPVELLSFAARRTGAGVSCAWATASEKNNSHFTVERSADGLSFEAIGRVAGTGNSSTRRDYGFVDARPLPGLSYYRLRQADFDGQETLSAVVTVAATSTDGTVTAVPNPGTGRFELWAGSTDLAGASGTITNVLGETVARIGTPRGDQRLVVDLTAQPAGLYLLRLRTAAGVQVLRLIKQ